MLDDVIRYQHGQEAVDNMHILGRLPIDGGGLPSMHAEYCGPQWHSHQLLYLTAASHTCSDTQVVGML